MLNSVLKFADNLSLEAKELITFLDGKLKTTIEAVREIPSQNSINLKEIERQIIEIKEEIKTASERDMPSLFYQLNLQHNLAKRMAKKTELPDTDSPFFAYMLLEDEKGGAKDYFLGHLSFISAHYKLRILDWKKAPLAQIFYQYREGEEYYLERDQGDLAGVLKKRCLINVHKGQLVRVERGDDQFELINGQWNKIDDLKIELEGGAGSAVRELPFGVGMTTQRSCEILGLLDQTQYDLIQRPSHKPLLIIGGAGSGKTTVALHRLGVLCEKHLHFPNQVLVVVPHQGLIRLSKKLLESIGQEKIKIKTADDWFLNQCQRIYPSIRYKVSKETPAFVSLVKRHPMIKELLENYVEAFLLKSKVSLEKAGIHFSKNVRNFTELERDAKSFGLDQAQQFLLNELLKSAKNILQHLHSIFSNHSLLMELVALSDNDIQQVAIEETLRRTLTQIRWMSEEGELDTSETLDGRSSNEGQRDSHLGFLDQEDFVLILQLTKMLWGKVEVAGRSLASFKHLVLDEAQELSTVELNILGDAIREGGQVTVAGDSLQQIDTTTSFRSWGQVLTDLGVDVVEPEELTISYRSPQHIIDLAHHVLGPLSDGNRPRAKTVGVPVKISSVEHLAHASLMLYEALENLFFKEKRASVAIICHNMNSAKMLYSQLTELQNVRLIEDSEFSFRPGIDITTVEQIRGLEFDYVIVPDAHSFAYPNTLNARKRLHLAITRAIHQVWVLYAQQRTPLITDQFIQKTL